MDGHYRQSHSDIWIFGTPLLVQEALDCHAAHAATDMLLAGRITQLRPDVNSWNVFVMSSEMLARHLAPEELHAPWTHILDAADELTVGIHYGSMACVDFATHTIREQRHPRSQPCSRNRKWCEPGHYRMPNVFD